MKIARIYLRVSTDEQDLTRQVEIEHSTRAAGYYIAGIYREKASGARSDRPELLRMIADLQPGEVVVAEKMDRISRLPLAEAEQLVASIRTKGAKLAVPGLVDLSDFAAAADGVARIVLESVQELLLRLALQMARDDYETRRERQRQGVQLAKGAGKYAGRVADTATHQRADLVSFMIDYLSNNEYLHQVVNIANSCGGLSRRATQEATGNPKDSLSWTKTARKTPR